MTTDEYRINRTAEGVEITLGPEGSPTVLLDLDAALDLAYAIIDSPDEAVREGR